MRSILWRSIGLALVLITVLAIGLQRLLSWFATSGEGWAEALLGPGFHTPLNVVAWIVSIAAGLGVVLGGIFLMPAITSLVASVYVDEVADHVELEHYPADHPGVALPLGVAMREGIKTALLTILVYLVALPFVFVAGAGFLVFFIATAWLLGREYFELAAMRFRPPAEAKAMRKDNAATIFAAGYSLVSPVSRAKGTSSNPTTATQASIAQASLTQSASDAFSTIGRTNATVASSGGPGGLLRNSLVLSPIACAAVTSPAISRSRKFSA